MASYRIFVESEMAKVDSVAERARVGINTATRVLGVLMEDATNSRKPRRKAPPPPDGGICLREAGRKYAIPDRTISRWYQNDALQEYVPILLTTDNAIYIHEAKFAELIGIYKSDLINGRRTIKKAIEILDSQRKK